MSDEKPPKKPPPKSDEQKPERQPPDPDTLTHYYSEDGENPLIFRGID